MSPPVDPTLRRMVTALDPETVGPTCLVTGARGFVGSRLVDALVALGCTVVAIDVRRTPRDPVPGVSHRRVDIGDRAALDELLAFRPVDVVFHCAGVVSLQGLQPPAEVARVMRANVVGTANVVAAARRANTPRLVFIGSAQVPDTTGTDASVPVAEPAADAFTRSKQYAERMVVQADTPGGLRTVVLRSASVWGAGGVLVPWLVKQLVTGSIRRWESGGGTAFAATHIDTLVRALLLGAAQLNTVPERVGGQAFAVTDGEQIGPTEWFAPIVDLLGYPPAQAAVSSRWLQLVAGWQEGLHRRGGRPAAFPRPLIRCLIASAPPNVARTRSELGWAPVLTQEEGLAELGPALHRMHAAAVAEARGHRLPFRAPDAAFVREPVPKLVFVVWDRAPKDRSARQVRLVEQVGAAVQAAVDPTELWIDVDGPHSKVASPSPFPLGARPVAGMLSVRSMVPDAAAQISEVLSAHGFDSAGYRVEASVYRDYGDNAHSGPRDWADGTRSPGVVVVTLFEKPPRIAYDDWLNAWHSGMSPVSEAIQPRTRYVRNRVLEPVTVGAPPLAGIVEECFASADHVRNPRLFYGARSTVELVQNVARILWTVSRFLQITRIQTVVMSEHFLRTPGWSGGPLEPEEVPLADPHLLGLAEE